MYGTIAEMRVKAGKKDEVIAELKSLQGTKIAGADALYLYQLDAQPDKFYMVLVFGSKESYLANASSPEQDRRNRSLTRLLEEPLRWYDGEIAYSAELGYTGL